MDSRLQDRLGRAIRGRGAFRYFKDVTGDHPRERERWFAFADERSERRVLDWLEYEGSEPIILEAPPALQTQPKDPTDRAFLIAEALAFVQAASRLPGGTRIALMGALTTEEHQPDSVDLQVTVTDEANLIRLAKEARKLPGHAQSLALGGEVYLSDPDGGYLGRTCPWKKCGPSVRRSCDALHCGRRLYLHDDLETARLPDGLIAGPPVELWPRVSRSVPVPEDVELALLVPLQEAAE